MLQNFTAKILHAGNLGPAFPLERGARQGDPLASLLFIACVEILANKIRDAKNIKFYVMNNTIIKIILYADDLNVYLQYDENSLRALIQILEDFKGISGLKIQLAKTQVVLLGTSQTDQLKLCPDLELKWDQTFKMLGIYFNADSGQYTVNYEEKINDIIKEVTNWKSRFVSIIGRKNIVNGLFLSKLTHLVAILPNLPNKKVKEVENILYDFIWGGYPKMARAEAKLSHKYGGLGLPDLIASWSALKLPWFRRIMHNKGQKWWELLQNKIACFIALTLT